MVSPLEDDPLLRGIPLVEGWKVLAPVVLYAKIGQGGMGAVYRGRHLDFDIDVAVKCLKPSLAAEDEQFIARFKREARLAAALTHENLIRIYEARKAHGLHYLVMEFIDGETARARVARKGPLEEHEAATIILGAALGLAKAHQHAETVIHRDVKPDNILISRRGEVKLLDLGIAKALEHDDGATFATQGVIGTPQYMAPEQWERDQALSPASDIWSFGATLYFLLTGENGIRAGTEKQIYVDICQRAFPDVRTKRPEVSAELAAIVSKCLQKDVALRYADASQLAKALEGFLGRRPTSLEDPATGTAATIALVSPPPMPTMKKIRNQVEQSTGEIATPAPAGTVIVRKPRRARWIFAGAAVVLAASAIGFALLHSRAPASSADATAPKLVREDPRNRSQLDPGALVTVRLEFDEPLQSAVANEQAGRITGNVAEFKLVAGQEGIWEVEYDVADAAGNATKDTLTYQSLAKPPPLPVRMSLSSPLLQDGVFHTKEDHLALRGQVENATGACTLLLGEQSSTLQLGADGALQLDPLLPLDRTTHVRLECGDEVREFDVVQDAQDPKISAVQPATGTRTRASTIDVEAVVTDANLASVTLDDAALTREGDVWRIRGVALEREGPNFFELRASDRAQRSAKARLLITRDQTRASLLSARPDAEEKLEAGSRRTLELTFNEELASARLTARGVELAGKLDGSRAQFELTVPSGEGPWSLDYEVADLAENRTTGSIAFVRTTKAAPPRPRIELIPRPEPLSYTNAATFTLRGRVADPDGSTGKLLVDGAPAPCTWEGGEIVGDVALAANARTKIELACSGDRVVFEVVQDSRPPLLELVHPRPDGVKERAIELEVRAVDANLQSVRLGGREMQDGGNGVYTLGDVELAREGPNVFEASARDKAGNSATLAIEIVRDTVAPELLADSEPKQGAALEPGKQVDARWKFNEAVRRLTLAGNVHVPAASDAQRADEVEFTFLVPEGSGPFVLQGTAEDLAGNTAEVRWSFERVAAPPDAGAPPNAGATSVPLAPELPSTLVPGSSAAPDGWTVLQAGPGKWAKKVQEPKSGIAFVLVEPGTFTMGSPTSEAEHEDQEKPHTVRLTSAFYLAESETTQAQYRKISGKSPSGFTGDALPVEKVSWSDAAQFCAAIGCELPTEAQWEYACRAGKTAPFGFGDTLQTQQANYNGSYPYGRGAKGANPGKTLPVKSLQPNAWGLYDMHGNVWEWCRNVYDGAAYSAPAADDPCASGKSKERVLRGGGWQETAGACRSASRYKESLGSKQNYIGFRCSRTLPR